MSPCPGVCCRPSGTVANDTASHSFPEGPAAWTSSRVLPLFSSPSHLPAATPSCFLSPRLLTIPDHSAPLHPLPGPPALLPSCFKLAPPWSPFSSSLLPSASCSPPPAVWTEDLLKVVLGALPGPGSEPGGDAKASHCRLAQVGCPAAWQGCPEAPQGFKGSRAYTFPTVLEETLSFLPCLSSFLAPVPGCSEAGHVAPAGWVSGCRGAPVPWPAPSARCR